MARDLLSLPNFRRFWLGQSASVIGDQLVVVALALFVTNLTGSATDLGLVLTAYSAPLVLLMLFGGVWADRLPRQRLVVATDLVRGALHALLAVLIFTGTVRVWELVAIEAGFGSAEAFFRPARGGLLPATVPEDLIQPASALMTTSDTVALLLGPALATALVVGAGAGWAFAIDAATFAVSALLIAGVRPRSRARAPERRPFAVELREGWHEVRSRTWVWVTIAVFSFALFAGYAPWLVLGPIVARRHYGATSAWGVIAIVFGVGAVAGSLAGLRWRPRHPMRAAFVACAPWPVALALLGAGAPLALVLAVALAFGAGFALFSIWWDTALAERVPPHALSRVTSYDWMGSLALLPLGFAVSGPLAAAAGSSTVLLAGAGVTAGLILLGVAPRETRALGRYAASATAGGRRRDTTLDTPSPPIETP